MKKLLLIGGIVLLAAAVLALLFAALNLLLYCRVLDGSAALYARLHQRAIIFFVLGAVLAVLGVAGVIVRGRL